jgi:hypothetical protein
MTDDQGDADFEASLAGMQPQDRGAAPATAADGQALHDLGATVEDLARRVHSIESAVETVLVELAGLRTRLGAERGTVVDQLQDHLADVASGEVVGALWDEVRGLRDLVEGGGATTDAPLADVLESIAVLRSEVEGIGAAVAASTEPVADPAVVAMRDDVQALADEVRGLSDSVAALDRSAAPATPAETDDGALEDDGELLVQLTEELATLRAELAEGLVVEPSDALSASLDALRSEVDALHAALSELRAPSPAPAPEPAPAGPSADLIATVFDELSGIRGGLDELRAQIEDGGVAVDAAGFAASPPAEVEVLGDQLAALRDLVASEIDGLRQAVVTAADRRDEELAQASAPAPTDVRARLDADTLEELRDEIRAAGAVSDQVIDALRDELKALRRRIAVKASERVLDDDQLAQIADAVAQRLAAERDG